MLYSFVEHASGLTDSLGLSVGFQRGLKNAPGGRRQRGEGVGGRRGGESAREYQQRQVAHVHWVLRVAQALQLHQSELLQAHVWGGGERTTQRAQHLQQSWFTPTTQGDDLDTSDGTKPTHHLHIYVLVAGILSERDELTRGELAFLATGDFYNNCGGRERPGSLFRYS